VPTGRFNNSNYQDNFLREEKVRSAMKFKVEVDETVWAVNTYIFEADSEEEIRMDIQDGNYEGKVELIESHTENSAITNVRSIKPYTETR